MAYPLNIGQDAQEDIIDSWIYYESKRQGLGDLFLEELDLIFIRISEMPKSFPIVYSKKRRAILQKFKFNIFFTFDGNDIQVLAVMHGSRDTKRWQER